MFSGIIESLGTVEKIIFENDGAEMAIRTPNDFRNFELGESIAVNGVCLTVRGFDEETFMVDMSTETLNRTCFKDAKEGIRVNLERSLTPNKKISGHFVSGHVDQVGVVEDIERKSGETLFRFGHPPSLSPFLIEKGSVAVDGISLTAFACGDQQFTVSIIPFTMDHTNLGTKKTGDLVNIECDMIGKYVFKACETLLKDGDGKKELSLDSLRQHGFL